MKKIFCLLLAIIITLSIPIEALAVQQESAPIEETDYYVDDYEEITDEDLADEIDYTCYEPITDPQLGECEEEEFIQEENIGSTIQPYSIVDTTENTDMTIKLSNLTQENIINRTNSSDLKLLINYNEIRAVVNKKYSSSYYPIIEGSDSDGQYLFYVVLIRSSASKTVGRGVLCFDFDESDQPVLKCSRFDSDYPALKNIHHGNDIAYNSLKDQLVFQCGDNEYSNKVAVANAAFFRGETNTLSISQKNISCQFSCIDYNASLNRYIVNVTSNQNMFCMLDSSFNLIGVVNSINDENAYHQGSYCDDNYIYSVYTICGDGATTENFHEHNVLVIHNWYGTRVKEVNFNIPRIKVNNKYVNYEIEGITMVGDRVIIGFNASYHNENGKEIVLFYYCDLSNHFFNIRYCKDSNVSAYISNNSLPTTNILYNVLTKVRKNTYSKKGYLFKGWNVYKVETGKWMYQDPNTGKYAWYKEGKQPSGYTKRLCTDQISLAQTTSPGTHLLLCAVWSATDYFYVSFNSNGGTGTMSSKSVKYGTSTKMPNNTFSRTNKDSGSAKGTFKGWNIYNVENEKWLYTSPDGNTRVWYKEGTQPTGYIKTAYGNGTTIAATAQAGQHLIFYALWNEYVIYYDSNGKVIKANAILSPTCVTYGVATNIKKYISDCIVENTIKSGDATNLRGYMQYRIDDNTWKFVKIATNTQEWQNIGKYDSSIYRFYVYTGNLSTTTCAIGRRVMFRARWA